MRLTTLQKLRVVIPRNFAKNANGDVTVLVGPNGIRDGSTFNRVEFPELLNNKNVNSINFIYLDN